MNICEDSRAPNGDDDSGNDRNSFLTAVTHCSVNINYFSLIVLKSAVLVEVVMEMLQARRCTYPSVRVSKTSICVLVLLRLVLLGKGQCECQKVLSAF